MSKVLLKRVSKYFGQTQIRAVKDLSLSVLEGEFMVILGPSGCGKSTILRLIAGLEGLSEGEIYIDGVLVNRVLPKDRDIAMVFQDYALYPHMTAYQNMAFGLRFRGYPREEIEEKVREVAEILGITPLLKRRPKELSGGERQRVALGRAIVRSPKVFLFDEPLSNLDAKLRQKMRQELVQLHKRLAATMIYVTHDQVEAMAMGTRIAVLNEGILQQVDTPRELYEIPANRFVASFLGTPAMNFFGVRPIKREDGIYLEGSIFSLKIGNEALLGHLDEEITLGVRPEDIIPSSPPKCLFKAAAEFIETSGPLTYVHLKADEIGFTMSVNPKTPIRKGDIVGLELDRDRIHLFGKDGNPI